MSQRAIDAILAAVRKGLGPEGARTLGAGGSRSAVSEVVSLGIGPLDHYVIGCGGLPVGRLTELYGEENSGKSSLAWQAAAQCQQAGGVAVLVETESGVSAERAAVFGVDLDSLVLIEPETMEDALHAMGLALKSMPLKGDGPNILIWDSIAATPTANEVKEGMSGDLVIGRRALLLSNACRVMKDLLPRARCAGLFVNQIREKIGIVFGDKTTTPGGRAVKFTASLRLQLLGGLALKDATGHTGKDLVVMATKNRFAPPWRKCRVRLNYADGWDDAWSTLTYAKTLGLVAAGWTVSAKHVEAARSALAAVGWAGTAVTAPGAEE